MWIIFFLLLCKWGRQQEERRGDYQNSLDEGMVFQVVSCNPTVPFISGTVCSSNPFIFFLTEVSVICSILIFPPMSLRSVSHSHAGLTPDPPYFFLWKNEWVLIFSSNIPHFLSSVRAIWEAFLYRRQSVEVWLLDELNNFSARRRSWDVAVHFFSQG